MAPFPVLSIGVTNKMRLSCQFPTQINQALDAAHNHRYVKSARAEDGRGNTAGADEPVWESPGANLLGGR